MTAYVHYSETPTIPPRIRCDRCYIAKAAVRVTFTFPWQGTLYFCGHHYMQHASLLDQAALAIEDERSTSGVLPVHRPEAVSQR